MQSELEDAYEQFKATTTLDPELATRLSAPLLLRVPSKWNDSSTRLLVVGQETRGWGFEKGEAKGWPDSKLTSFAEFRCMPESVPALVDWYERFNFGRYHAGLASRGLWRAYWMYRRALGEDSVGFDTAVLSTNLFRMAYDEGSPLKLGNLKDHPLLKASVHLLRKEIAILEPSAVIFHTGPNYEFALRETFQDLQPEPMVGFDPSRTSRIRSSLLPATTWRTYHPSYLNWPKRRHILEAIAEELIRSSNHD